MNDDDEKVVYFGETDARNRRLKFGIKKKDRSRHLYAIGKTGMGKSTLLENLAVQDIQNGDGICFLDPHGKSADLLLEYVPKDRIKDVIYFAPFDMDYPISFNVMEDVGPERRYLVASGLMAAFKKIWVDAWSARMEYILGNIMLALLEYPGSTLVGVNRMLTDKDFRKEVVSHITDPSVKSFWVNEYASYTEKFAAEAAPAIQNKVGQFIANPLIRNIIGQANSSFDIRKIMDEKKILIINLSKGRVGEANANLLGSMLITKIYLGAMSRADLSEKELAKAPNFYFYVDEFQSFANESFADILSEARKYKLNLHIAHQYIEQMTDEVRAAVFGNVGTMCVFRVGAYDGEVLEKEFTPTFLGEDIVNLQKYQMYLKLMIDGVTSQPFSAFGMSPIPKPEISYVKEIMDSSRSLYAHPRQEVEEEILTWIQKNFANKGGSSTGPREGGGREGGSGASGGGGGGTANGSERSAPRREGGLPSSASNGSASAPARYSASPQSGSSQGGVRSVAPSSNTNQSTNSRGSQTGGHNVSGSNVGHHSTSNSAGHHVTPRPHSPHKPALRPDTPVSTLTIHTAPVEQKTIPQTPTPPYSSPLKATEPSERPREAETATMAREDQLRKAVSLSYLKSEQKEKKDVKTPKPENIAALREALLAVMGTGPTSHTAETIVEDNSMLNVNKDIPTPVDAPEVTPARNHIKSPEPTAHHKKEHHMENLLNNLEKKKEHHHSKDTQHHESKKPHHHVQKEVAEDLLKSVFDSK